MEHDLKKFTGYPMVQSESGKVKKSLGSIQEGIGDIKVCSLDEISINDKLLLGNGGNHTVIEILEKRKPKGKHDDNAMFYHVKTSFQRNAPSA